MIEWYVITIEAMVIVALLFYVAKLRERKLLLKPGRKYALILYHGSPPKWYIYELDKEETPMGIRTKEGFYIQMRTGEILGSKVLQTEKLTEEYVSRFYNEMYGELIKIESRSDLIKDPKKGALIVDPYPEPIRMAIAQLGSKNIFDAIMNVAKEKIAKAESLLIDTTKRVLATIDDITNDLDSTITTVLEYGKLKSSKEFKKKILETRQKLEAMKSIITSEAETLITMDARRKATLLELAKARGLSDEEIRKLSRLSTDEIVEELRKRGVIA